MAAGTRWLRGIIGRLSDRLGRAEPPPRRPVRGAVDHVIVADGTMSTLTPGRETNAGLTWKILHDGAAPAMSLRYEGGVQWTRWADTRDIVEGRGIDRQIQRMYGFLASRYRSGDRIFLFGYSRGAYAVRSLAGVIDTVGLVRADHATERNVRLAWRHYERGTRGAAHRAFTRRFCHDAAPIEMVGVWDTVKALGIRVPLLWKWMGRRHAFHNHALGQSVRHGYQALALDETREAFRPVMWETPDDWDGHVEQMWFRGSHGDVGGHLWGHDAARPLSNIPLVWMLERAEARGLTLPDGWRGRIVTDPAAPSVGTWSGWGKLFVLRRRRVVGADRSERIHHTAFLDRPLPRRCDWDDLICAPEDDAVTAR